tara:strand:+ start:6475 stop:7842 length:1368 start_codon:yes stop_codon:yes gene_type:complete
MFTKNILLDIISIIVIVIIIIIIFINCIYTNKNNYIEKYSNFEENIVDNETQQENSKNDEFTNKDLLKKCPRGCGHHPIAVPNCNECNKDKKDFDKLTPKEKMWIDKYHIVGDQMELYAKNKMLEWKNIDGNIKFRYIFLKDNKLHHVNIHPDYYNILYNEYNPEKNNSNYKDIAEWMKTLTLDVENYSHLTVIKNTNDWKYIDIEPKQWIKDCIYDFVLKNKLYSEEFKNNLSVEEKKKYNIIDIETKLTEYLSNIGKPLDKSFNKAQIRWKMFEDSTNNLVNKDLYSLKIIENISNGNGFHIDDLILLFNLNKIRALEYINHLIEKLEYAEQNREEFIKTYKTNNNCENDCFIFKLKTDCIYNDDKSLFTEINIPVKTKNNSNVLIYNFWPIFQNNNYTINKKTLLDNGDNGDNDYCSNETLCYNSNNISKEHCLFLNPSSISSTLMNYVISS